MRVYDWFGRSPMARGVAAAVLVEEAQAGNIDGIALSYVEMTLTCVRCHRHLSRARIAD